VDRPELAPYKPSLAAIAQFLKLHEPTGITHENSCVLLMEIRLKVFLLQILNGRLLMLT
jgi:hypothetical protein